MIRQSMSIIGKLNEGLETIYLYKFFFIKENMERNGVWQLKGFKSDLKDT